IKARPRRRTNRDKLDEESGSWRAPRRVTRRSLARAARHPGSGFGRHGTREIGEADPREIEPLQPTHPPLPSAHVSIGVSKAIVVEQRADVLRRAIQKRIAGQQAQHGWTALQ